MSPLRRRGAGMRVCASANLKTRCHAAQEGELCEIEEWSARTGCHHGARRLGMADLERRAADWPSEPAGPRAGGSGRPQGVCRSEGPHYGGSARALACSPAAGQRPGIAAECQQIWRAAGGAGAMLRPRSFLRTLFSLAGVRDACSPVPSLSRATPLRGVRRAAHAGRCAWISWTRGCTAARG